MSIDQSSRDWIRDAVLYQVFPPGYYDADGDGVGDLPGIIEKLDYIADLGVNLLWLGPCYDSPFQDAGYDVRDFYRVAPRYGTNEDLQQLCAEAHKRGLRVCLDLVAGHTSIECEWFKQSCRTEPNKYSRYYIWTDQWFQTPDYGKWINGYAPRNGNFMTNFFYCQPALNFGFANPDPDCPWEETSEGEGPRAVIDELKNIIRFWLDLGCDGFRVDMASSLIKNDNDHRQTVRLWRENILPWLRGSYPHAAAIAEWGDPTVAVGEADFDIDFMLHVGVPGYGEMFFKHPAVCGRPTDGVCFFDQSGHGTPEVFLKHYFRAYRQIQDRGFISIPSANHDFQRLNYFRSVEEMKTAFVFLLTWPCVPAIYYGDEIGMRFQPRLPSKEGGYTRTGSRTPMQWSRGVNAGFSAASPEKIYLPVDHEEDRPNVEQQLADPDSLLNHVRKLLQLRKLNPALGNHGEIEVLSKTDSRILVYRRRVKNSSQYLIAINPSNFTTTISLPSMTGAVKPLLNSGLKIKKTQESGMEIAFSGLSWGIFKIGV